MLGIVGLVPGALFAQIGGLVFLVPAIVTVVGCAAAVMLMQGWNGGPLWDDREASETASPTAQASAG
jgi:hypothetical protein